MQIVMGLKRSQVLDEILEWLHAKVTIGKQKAER